MDEIVDRETELGEHREMATADQRQMALLYGRRRVGKTFLLTHAWRDRDVEQLYFTASATSPAINRRARATRRPPPAHSTAWPAPRDDHRRPVQPPGPLL